MIVNRALIIVNIIAVLAGSPTNTLAVREDLRPFTEFDAPLIVVLGCGQKNAPDVAAELGRSGNSVVHAIAGSPQERETFNQAIVTAEVQGCVSVEELELTALPYRDYMINTMIIMDLQRAQADGFTLAEARRCMAPHGKLVSCKAGKIDQVEIIPLPAGMDVWTHRYYRADGIAASHDSVFDLPVGFKWSAGLPMNFSNPKRAGNRYSSTRAMVVDDGRCFTFSTAVCENLGDGWTSDYGTDQYLTCRDAFNGRFLWRKCIGDTYYGGLYIQNLAPLVSTVRRLYLAGENGAMLVVDSRTGQTLRELPTTYYPGVIAVADGIVVTATWKNGRAMGAAIRYDRRRMDWANDTGSVEAYDEESGKLLWKHDFLGTSLLIATGRVFIVNRNAGDPVEEAHNKVVEGQTLSRPPNRVMAFDLQKGTLLWTIEPEELDVTGQTLSLEAATDRAVAVAHNGLSRVKLISTETGKLLDDTVTSDANTDFFRYRNHICTPAFRVNDIGLANRGGTLAKLKQGGYKFAGARAACLTGTIPAYGAGYIAQNWCNCSPGQIPGLLAIAPIGRVPEPDELQLPVDPITCSSFDAANAEAIVDTEWVSFRGTADRSSSVTCDIATNVTVKWTARVTRKLREGTVKRDWRAYLNSRLTAATLTGALAIVGDIDHNEIIAIELDSGNVAWRFVTGGRMDTAPTVYKGICLVGDHSGYVSAINVQTGGLIYRLRIAPQEKRMLSYGKVESVWPVIGGVMVAQGRAFATAGRTQGSDGGLVVRAFEPLTGKHTWTRALPQSGNGIVEENPRRNDAIILEGEGIRVMDHYLKPETGEIFPGPAAVRRE